MQLYFTFLNLKFSPIHSSVFILFLLTIYFIKFSKFLSRLHHYQETVITIKIYPEATYVLYYLSSEPLLCLHLYHLYRVSGDKFMFLNTIISKSNKRCGGGWCRWNYRSCGFVSHDVAVVVEWASRFRCGDNF